MRTFAITGASGFIGRHLVDACRVSGDVRLQVLSRKPSPFGVDDGLIHHVGDLGDPASLDAFVGGADCVIHLAYLSGGREANVAAANNLITAVKKAGVRRVVHCSTAVVVGNDAASPIGDDAPARPTGDYQATKFAIESALKSGAADAVELAILRPTEVIGPGGAGLDAMIRRIRNGGAGNLLRRAALGARRFNYVPVKNVVAAILLLAGTQVPQRGNVYNVSDDDDADNTYAAVEDIVRDALGKAPTRLGAVVPASLLSLAFKLLPGHAPPDRVYTHAGLDRLGYRRVTSLRSAILELVTETR